MSGCDGVARAQGCTGYGQCLVQDVASDEAYVMRMLDAAAQYDINYIELLGPY